MIPPRTQQALLTDFAPGTRHEAKVKIALPLIGEGLPASAVEATLREKFPQASEKECRDVVAWCQNKNPQPCPLRNGAPRSPYTPAKQVERKMSPQEAAKAFVNGSQANIGGSFEGNHAIALLGALYKPEECVNIVCKFTTTEKDGKTKANPAGSGATKTVKDWIDWIKEKGVPQSQAGAWMRPNPVKPRGSGYEGAICNSDITAFRFLLLESDCLDTEQQLAIYANLKMKIPIAAILSSGGKSCHAWLRLDAKDAEDYAAKTARIYGALEQFGFDKANKNPSRLSRLPGAVRKIGATGDGIQKLIAIFPEVTGITDDQINALDTATKLPKFQPINFKNAMMDALEFYDDIYRNKKKTGLRTGFYHFDSLTGGLKPGWLTIVAGETNSGKTSFALNIINNALIAGKSIALFSFEMDMQEIIDILFAQNAKVNRNHFNNGYFSNADFDNMNEKGELMQHFKIHTFDDPTMTIADVMESCEYLKGREHGLDLIVIDYLQLANTEAYLLSREQQVAAIARGAKAMAKKTRCPVIGISQLNEEGKMRESRGIGHDANCVIKITVPDPEKPETVIARVEKGRSIPKGEFYFKFEPVLCLFQDNGCEERLKNMIPKEPNEKETRYR